MSASLENKNTFYQAIFERFRESYEWQGILAGLNFWGFAGYAGTDENNGKWEEGDDFTTDPPQEPQGLNSVFAGDVSTLGLINKYNIILNR